MNILIIHEVSYEKKPVYEYQDFAERLASMGHQVTVIDFDENRKSALAEKYISKTNIGTIKLISLPNNGLPIIKYITAKLSYPSQLKKIISENGADAVLLYSVFINGTGTVKVCRELGIPIVFRALDAYHKLRRNFFESWLLLQSEKYIYKNVNSISVTNKQMGKYINTLVPEGLGCPIHITDHGVDTDHFRRISRDDQLAKSLSIDPNDFICVFLGTTYSFSRLDKMVTHIDKLRRSIPNFKLLILGSGELDGAIRNKTIELNISGYVIQPGMIPYDKLPSYLSLAKLAINPFEINDITRDIIPIKILQYLASELPVISTPLPDVKLKIPQTKSGVFYSEDDKIDTFITYLIKTVQLLDHNDAGKRAREYVSNHHSMNRVIGELIKILEN